MKKGQFWHFNSILIFGTFLKFWYLINPLNPKDFSIFEQLFFKKYRTKNLILARFRGPLKLNLVFLESHRSLLSISITYLAPESPRGTRQGLLPWTCFCALRAHKGANGLNTTLWILIFAISNFFSHAKRPIFAFFPDFWHFFEILVPN